MIDKGLERRIKVGEYTFGLSDGAYCGKGIPQPFGKPDPALLEAGKEVEKILFTQGIKSTSSYVGEGWVDVQMR